MSSFPSSHPLPSSSPTPSSQHGLVATLLPQGSLPLLLLWLMLAPLALLTAESLLMPLADSMQLLSQGLTPGLGAAYWIKLVLFLVLSWLGITQVSLRLQVLYTAAWSQQYPRPHAKHVDYLVDLREAMLSLIAWNTYRWLRLMVPPILLACLTVVLGYAEIALFNTLLINPALSLPIPFILGLFLLLSMAVVTGLMVVRSLLHGLRTLFGSCVAITEPDLPLQTVFERCLRLSDQPWWRLGLVALGYFGGWLLMLGYVVWLLLNYNIETLVMMKASWWPVLALAALLMAYLITFQAIKWHAYHSSLVVGYQRIPTDLLNACDAPPTRAERLAHWLGQTKPTQPLAN